MKKLFLTITALILALLLLSACTFFAPDNSETNTETSTETNTETNTEINTEINTDTSTEAGTENGEQNVLQLAVTYKTEKKSYYEKVLYYFGQYEYVANDLPKDYGDFYKVVKSYDDFSELVKSNYLDKSLFENNYILVIHRKYGGRYIEDMGFSNFRIENGEAFIDLYEYTGNMNYPDCEFLYTEYYVIPNTIECEATEFKPLTINKTSIYSYDVSFFDAEGLELGNTAMIFDGYSEFKEFEDLLGVKSYASYFDKDGYFIVIERPVLDVASVGPLKLEGEKLMLTIDDSALHERERGQYMVIGVSKEGNNQQYDFFNEKIPNDCTLEIIINENNQPSFDEIDYAQKNRPETPYDMFLEALLFNHNNDNLTSRIDKVIIKQDGTVIYGSEISRKDDNVYCTESTTTNLHPDGTVSVGSYAYFTNYQDRYNEYSLQIENGVWVKYDGVLKTESIYSHFNVPNLQNHFKELSYDEETGIYSADIIASYITIYDLRLKIENGCVSYVSFRQGGTWEGAIEELVIITTYDVGTTVVVEPTVGEEAVLTAIEPSEEILAEVERIINERE